MTGIKVIDEENEVDVENYHKDERNDDEEKLDYENDEEEKTG